MYVCIYIHIYIFFFSPISGVINNPPASEGDTGSIPGLGQEDPLEWQLASVFLPGKFHGQRSLVGYSPWGFRVQHDWAIECTYMHAHTHTHGWASLVAQMVKNLPAMQETWVQSPCLEDPPEEGMATHFSILTWGIPWTEKPSRLQPIGFQRAGHDWATKHST